uniref:Vacuolar protein sorting-associated protein 45 n=1 Tax=Piliocolobus tephrosceles TaxID=591936 RepID=A0A8C9GSZ0_9PRIM
MKEFNRAIPNNQSQFGTHGYDNGGVGYGGTEKPNNSNMFVMPKPDWNVQGHSNDSVICINGENIMKNDSKFYYFENLVITRIVDGIFSLLCATKQIPDIIYNKHSSICKHIIDLLKIKMLKHEYIFSGVLDAYEKYNELIKKNEMQQHNIGKVAGAGTGAGAGGATTTIMTKKKKNTNQNLNLNYMDDSPYHLDNLLMNEHMNNNLIANPVTITEEGNCCYMIIIDRREDPVTPLLTQWTYQAMLHELVGINNNTINLNNNSSNNNSGSSSNSIISYNSTIDRSNGINKRKDSDINEIEKDKIVMSCNYDSFYNEHLFDNFGDLGQAVNNYVNYYQEETAKKSKIESIDDIEKFIELFPNYKKLSNNVTKHVNILHSLSTILEKRQLFMISEIEQDIFMYNKKNEHIKKVLDLIKNDKYTNYDVLRVSLLFCLKYEDKELIKIIKNELIKRNINQKQIILIDALLLYSNVQIRNNKLFKEQSLLNYAKSTISRTIIGTPNVLTLHKSYIYFLLEDLIKSKLNNQIYTTTNLLNIEPNMNKTVNSIIIFFIGGATYEEYKDIKQLSKKYNIQFLLGSTQIHNSQSFLA